MSLLEGGLLTEKYMKSTGFLPVKTKGRVYKSRHGAFVGPQVLSGGQEL